MFSLAKNIQLRTSSKTIDSMQGSHFSTFDFCLHTFAIHLHSPPVCASIPWLPHHPDRRSTPHPIPLTQPHVHDPTNGRLSALSPVWLIEHAGGGAASPQRVDAAAPHSICKRGRTLLSTSLSRAGRSCEATETNMAKAKSRAPIPPRFQPNRCAT